MSAGEAELDGLGDRAQTAIDQIGGPSVLRSMGTNFADIAADMDELPDTVTEVEDQTVQTMSTLERMGQTVATSVGSVVDVLVSKTSSLQSALASVLGSILTIAANAGLRAIFPGAPQGAFGGLAMGGIVPQSVPLQTFARGGIGGVVRRPTLFLAGEGKEPAEAFVPLPDGKRIPVQMNGAEALVRRSTSISRPWTDRLSWPHSPGPKPRRRSSPRSWARFR